MIKYSLFKEINVRYSDEGKGRVIVLLHGFMESMEIWKDFSKDLARSFRVICIDLPGFGDTPSIGYVHSMELLAACVKAVLDTEGLRRYVLLGHSMGGYVALAFTDLFHDNVKGLCLFHSTALADTDEKKRSRDKAIQLVKKNPLAYVRLFFEPLFAAQNVKNHQEDIVRLEENAKAFSKRAIINSLEGMKDRKRRDWILEMSKFPILFIIGKQDSLIPFESVLKQTKLVKNPDVLLLENAGHMGFLEARQETWKTVRKFTWKCFKKTSGIAIPE